jgi:hypothetical protein
LGAFYHWGRACIIRTMPEPNDTTPTYGPTPEEQALSVATPYYSLIPVAPGLFLEITPDRTRTLRAVGGGFEEVEETKEA